MQFRTKIVFIFSLVVSLSIYAEHAWRGVDGESDKNDYEKFQDKQREQLQQQQMAQLLSQAVGNSKGKGDGQKFIEDIKKAGQEGQQRNDKLQQQNTEFVTKNQEQADAARKDSDQQFAERLKQDQDASEKIAQEEFKNSQASNDSQGGDELGDRMAKTLKVSVETGKAINATIVSIHQPRINGPLPSLSNSSPITQMQNMNGSLLNNPLARAQNATAQTPAAPSANVHPVGETAQGFRGIENTYNPPTR